MIRWIIGSSVKYRLAVLAAAIALLVIGINQLRDTPHRGASRLRPVRVEVQTEALGLSPEEVENLITNPMEQEFFNGIPWLHKIRSDSAPGLSSVEMIFEPGTDPIRARQVVQERLTMVPALPQVSKPPFVIQPTATTGRLMMIGLSSKDLSLIEISVLARWKIRQRLLAVPGVGNVSIWGFRDRQLQVLGRSISACAGAASNVRRSHPHGRERNVVLASDLRGGVDAGNRRLHRHRAPAHFSQSHTADQDSERPRAGHGRGRSPPAAANLSEVADIVEIAPAAHRRRTG